MGFSYLFLALLIYARLSKEVSDPREFLQPVLNCIRPSVHIHSCWCQQEPFALVSPLGKPCNAPVDTYDSAVSYIPTFHTPIYRMTCMYEDLELRGQRCVSRTMDRLELREWHRSAMAKGRSNERHKRPENL